jgi:hypothetical protein
LSGLDNAGLRDHGARFPAPTGSKPMPASMFTVIRISGRDGRSRPHYVSLPLVTVLHEERFKYFTLPDEPEPPAASDVTAGYVFTSPLALRAAVQRVCDRMKQLCDVEPVGEA